MTFDRSPASTVRSSLKAASQLQSSILQLTDRGLQIVPVLLPLAGETVAEREAANLDHPLDYRFAFLGERGVDAGRNPSLPAAPVCRGLGLLLRHRVELRGRGPLVAGTSRLADQRRLGAPRRRRVRLGRPRERRPRVPQNPHALFVGHHHAAPVTCAMAPGWTVQAASPRIFKTVISIWNAL